MIVENDAGGAAQIEDAAEWRDGYGLTFPVLADTEKSWVETWGIYDETQPYTQHSYTVIDPEGKVRYRQLRTEGDSAQLIDELLEAHGL